MSFHRRRLPHYSAIGHPIFLTWRLHGSLPDGRSFPHEMDSGRVFVAMDRLLDDVRSGPLYLKRPEVAKMIIDALKYHSEIMGHYELHHFVVMANHVHVLVTPRVAVSKLMQSLKRHTAREGNRLVGVRGLPFWQEERYDRLVRDAEEFHKIASYVEMNPVRAGLVAAPEEFPWSSAGKNMAD
jgi:REP element-mobilizing transposase RayT